MQWRLPRIRQFIEVDLWKIQLADVSKGRRLFYQQLKVWTIAISEVVKDKISEKASALTYFSILSVVPVLAMAFGIAKGFGLEKYLDDELNNFFQGSGQTTVLDTSIDFAKKMIETANEGVIAGISLVFLIYAVLRLLNNIESAFNHIWQTKSRNWQRKISDYLAIVIIGPILIILSGSGTFLVTTSLNDLSSSYDVLNYLKPLLAFSRYFLIWIFLTILYLIFPNTKVRFLPALVAGILAGTVYELLQIAWINGQVFLTRYNTIYGSLAVLPLFLIWLQLSWTIILFGAEYAFAFQNVNTTHYKSDEFNLSITHRRSILLLILKFIVQNFKDGLKPLTVSETSEAVGVPYRYVLDICRELESAEIVNKVATDDDEAFQPALDINKLDISLVMNRLDSCGVNEPLREYNGHYQDIQEAVQVLKETVKSSPANKLVKDL